LPLYGSPTKVYGKGGLNVPRITPERNAIITQYVSDCSIWRLTAEETAEYLALQGFPMDSRTVKKYRAKIRKSAGSWIARLAMSKRNDYIHEYQRRAEEIEHCQRELWAINNNKKNQTPADKIRIEALTKLMECTRILTDLYDRVPVVNAIRDYDNTTATTTHREQEQQV
jgi:hypothetical protein